jgi:CAAX protease family protein
MALMGLITSAYLCAFHRHLRFPNVLVLLPLALVASWALNVARISILFLIGANGNPRLSWRDSKRWKEENARVR